MREIDVIGDDDYSILAKNIDFINKFLNTDGRGPEDNFDDDYPETIAELLSKAWLVVRDQLILESRPKLAARMVLLDENYDDYNSDLYQTALLFPEFCFKEFYTETITLEKFVADIKACTHPTLSNKKLNKVRGLFIKKRTLLGREKELFRRALWKLNRNN